MKRFILSLALLCGALLSINAQVFHPEALEQDAIKKYGDKWEDAAAKLKETAKLDKNNALNISRVISAPGKTASELYVLLNYWFASTFDNLNSIIRLQDKDLGAIIVQGYVPYITGYFDAYFISISPIIKCDIKNDKVRVICTVPYYSASEKVGGGLTGTWFIDQCYPHISDEKKFRHNKKLCSRALIITYTCLNEILDNIEECVKNGTVGDETIDW